MLISLVFAYCSGVIINGTKARQNFVACIAEAELSVLSLGAYLRAFHVGPAKRFSFSRLIEECNSQSLLMKVPDAMVKE